MPWGETFEQKLSAQFKCPAYARSPPSSLTLISALHLDLTQSPSHHMGSTARRITQSGKNKPDAKHKTDDQKGS